MRRETALKWFEQEKDYMNRRVEYGIESYRKADAMLAFVDQQGNPVKDISFHVKLVQHDFDFGCNLFLLDEFENEEKNREYRRIFPEIFNYATIPFYWRDLEPEKGKPRFAKDSPKIYRRPAPDLCVEYCKQHHIRMKGHCLCYDAFAPKWVAKERDAYIRQIDHRMQEISARYSQDIQDWDVTNETFWHPSYRVTPFYRDPDYMKVCYALANKYFPLNKKIVNEAHAIWYGDDSFHYYNTQFYLQLENMLLKNIEFDAIGFQMHQFSPREKEEEYARAKYHPKYLYDVLDTFGTLKKDIQISEVTIASYSHEEEDMQVQAELLTNMYKIWFSHPSISSIIYWNMADGYTYNPKGSGMLDMSCGENVYAGGLLKPDLTPKPAFTALKKLIHEEWHTEGDFQTLPGTNYATFRGFKGKYEITFTRNGRQYTKEFHLMQTDFDDFACETTVQIVL